MVVAIKQKPQIFSAPLKGANFFAFLKKRREKTFSAK